MVNHAVSRGITRYMILYHTFSIIFIQTIYFILEGCCPRVSEHRHDGLVITNRVLLFVAHLCACSFCCYIFHYCSVLHLAIYRTHPTSVNLLMDLDHPFHAYQYLFIVVFPLLPSPLYKWSAMYSTDLSVDSASLYWYLQVLVSWAFQAWNNFDQRLKETLDALAHTASSGEHLLKGHTSGQKSKLWQSLKILGFYIVLSFWIFQGTFPTGL